MDRLLSAYEFALEVAVRGLRPNRRPPDPKKVPHAQHAPPHTFAAEMQSTTGLMICSAIFPCPIVHYLLIIPAVSHNVDIYSRNKHRQV